MNYSVEDISYNFNLFSNILCFYLVKANKILIQKKKSVFQGKRNHTHAKIGIREEQCIISFFPYVKQTVPVSAYFFASRNTVVGKRFSEHNVLYLEVQI